MLISFSILLIPNFHKSETPNFEMTIPIWDKILSRTIFPHKILLIFHCTSILLGSVHEDCFFTSLHCLSVILKQVENQPNQKLSETVECSSALLWAWSDFLRWESNIIAKVLQGIKAALLTPKASKGASRWYLVVFCFHEVAEETQTEDLGSKTWWSLSWLDSVGTYWSTPKSPTWLIPMIFGIHFLFFY